MTANLQPIEVISRYGQEQDREGRGDDKKCGPKIAGEDACADLLSCLCIAKRAGIGG